MGKALLRSGLSLCGALVAIVTSGCTRTIDGSKVEGMIKQTASDKGITLSAISCPQSQKAQSGGTFECTSTTSDGDAITWQVTQKDDQGNVDFKSPTVMDQQKLGDLVEPQLKAKAGGDIDMKCPSKWLVAKAGAKFTCDATVQGNPAKVDCTFSDGSNYDCKAE